jgi:hypothetical protein
MALNFAPNKVTNSCSACGFGSKNDELRFAKYGKIDETYVTFSNEKQSPYYARIGIQYVPYGYYDRNIIPATLPQLMTQTQAVGVTAGYTNPDNGMNLAIFSFSSKNKRNTTTKINNFGLQAGYIKGTEEEYNLITLGWMNNIANSVNYLVSSNPTCCGFERNPLNSSYRKQVRGLSTTLKHENLNWDASIQYTSALSKFHPEDIEWQNKGAKPSAGLIDIGHHFKAFNEKKNRIGASYQLSNQAVNLKGNYRGTGLPKKRIQGNYTIELDNNIEFGTHIFWDQDYSKNKDSTGKNSTTMLLTLTIKLG